MRDETIYLTLTYIVHLICYKLINVFIETFPFEYFMGAGIVGAWVFYFMTKGDK